MNQERCINAYYEKISNHKVILYDNINALIDAWNYGTATPMIALINALHRTYDKLMDGEIYQYHDISGKLHNLEKHNFKDFVLYYFDDFVYNEVIEDYKKNQYS
jgi:hypothetical protein